MEEKSVLIIGFLLVLSSVWGMNISESMYPIVCKIVDAELRVYIDPSLHYMPRTLPKDAKIIAKCDKNCILIVPGQEEDIRKGENGIIITIPRLDDNIFEDIIESILEVPCSEYQPVSNQIPEMVGEENAQTPVDANPPAQPPPVKEEINQVEYNEEEIIVEENMSIRTKGTNKTEKSPVQYSEEKSGKKMTYRAENAQQEVEEKLKEIVGKAKDEEEVVLPTITGIEMEIEVNGIEVKCEQGICKVEGNTDVLRGAILIPTVLDVNGMQKIVWTIEKRGAKPTTVLQIKKPIAEVIDLNKTVVSEVALPEPEKNKVTLYYAAKGYVPVVVDLRIPKAYVDDINKIVGNVVFLETDPVVRIHLSTMDGNVDIEKVEILGTSELNVVRKVSFATCTVYVDNLSISYEREGDKYKVSMKFQVMDDGAPVYLRNLRIRFDEKEIFPQFDSESKEYSAVTTTVPGTHTLQIVGTVPGCADIDFKKEITIHKGNNLIVVGTIAIVLLAGILYGIWRAVG